LADDAAERELDFTAQLSIITGDGRRATGDGRGDLRPTFGLRKNPIGCKKSMANGRLYDRATPADREETAIIGTKSLDPDEHRK